MGKWSLLFALPLMLFASHAAKIDLGDTQFEISEQRNALCMRDATGQITKQIPIRKHPTEIDLTEDGAYIRLTYPDNGFVLISVKDEILLDLSASATPREYDHFNEVALWGWGGREKPAEKPKRSPKEVLLELRGAYYYPTSDLFRDIYKGAGMGSVELSVQAGKGFYPWLSFSYIGASGVSTDEHEKTRIYMLPIGLGLKYIFLRDRRLRPYLGLGMVVAYSHLFNDTDLIDRIQTDWSIGGIAKVGALAFATRRLFFDLFIDYTYLKANYGSSNGDGVFSNKVNLSGLAFGGGIGIRF